MSFFNIFQSGFFKTDLSFLGMVESTILTLIVKIFLGLSFLYYFIYYYYYYYYYCLLRTTPMVYEGTQARAWIGAVAATAAPDPSHICELHHNSPWQHQILKPLSEAKDWTCIFMGTTQVHYCWAKTWGTPLFIGCCVNKNLAGINAQECNCRVVWLVHM